MQELFKKENKVTISTTIPAHFDRRLKDRTVEIGIPKARQIEDALNLYFSQIEKELSKKKMR